METSKDFVLTFLVNSVWQVTVIALITIGCAKLLGHASERFQHILWVLALILSVVLPLLSLLQKPDGQIFGSIFRSETVLSLINPNVETAAEENTLFAEDFPANRSILNSVVSITPTAIIAFYLLFLLYRIARLGRGIKETRRIRRSAYRRKLTASIESAVSICQNTFGIKNIRVLCSTDVAVPVTMGGFSPVIILPESLFDAGGSEELLRAAIGHETAHIRRRDFALNLIYECLYLLISFHPAATLIRRRIVETRELACDEAVTAQLLNKRIYARSLISLAALLTKSEPQAFMMGATSGDILTTRIERLVGNSSYASSRKGKLLLTLSAFLLAASCGIFSAFSFNFVRGGNRKNITGVNEISGIWRGTWQELPGATLIIKSVGGGIKGAATFYLLKKKSTGLEVAENTGEIPFIEPKIESNVLSFKLKRHQGEDVIKAKMIFTGENEAVLKLESDEIKGGGNETKMRRDLPW